MLINRFADSAECVQDSAAIHPLGAATLFRRVPHGCATARQDWDSNVRDLLRLKTARQPHLVSPAMRISHPAGIHAMLLEVRHLARFPTEIARANKTQPACHRRLYAESRKASEILHAPP